MPKNGLLKGDPWMCVVHRGQHYWGSSFNWYFFLGDSIECLALQFMELSLVFRGEDADGFLKHSAKVLHRGFMLDRNV